MTFEFNSLKEALNLDSDEKCEIIKTKHTSCPFCGGKIECQTRSQNKGDLVCYTDNGVKKLQHLEYRCQEKHCRAGLFHGFNVKKGGMKIFEEDCLQNKYLVTSRKTAFSISLLYNTTLKIYHHNGTFERLSSEYNDFFNFGIQLNNLLFYD